jgi:CheY-like chemotaxis protein
MKKHILLVEDNERLRSNLLFVLNREGFDAVGATNGTEALKIIAKDPPDLVVSDIMMPDMDGYDLVKHLRESTLTLSLPVIFLTAKTAPEELRSGMLYGVDDYLTKPVNINDLLAAINVRLERAEKQKKNGLRILVTYKCTLLLFYLMNCGHRFRVLWVRPVFYARVSTVSHMKTSKNYTIVLNLQLDDLPESQKIFCSMCNCRFCLKSAFQTKKVILLLSYNIK